MEENGMDNWGARTLSELPQHISGYNKDRHKFTSMGMIKTGYHRWGFVVYRCTYDDDDLWNRYLAQLKKNLYDELVEGRRAELLEQYLDWVVIEDRDNLQNASKADVRKHFNQWVSQHSAEIARYPLAIDLPRFKHCLYVDQKCLDTLEPFQKSEGDPALQGSRLFKYTREPMVLAIVDRLWTPDRRDGNVTMNDRGYPPIEGCDRKYVGWEYANASCMASYYNELHGSDLDDYTDYLRPPAISPGGFKSMPE
ncbi:hypothetical protein EsH8_V_001179 [Colletotrichum jinshuiense]